MLRIFGKPHVLWSSLRSDIFFDGQIKAGKKEKWWVCSRWRVATQHKFHLCGVPSNFQFLGRAEHTRVPLAKLRLSSCTLGNVREKSPRGKILGVSKSGGYLLSPDAFPQSYRRCWVCGRSPASACTPRLWCIFYQPHDHLSLMGYNSKVFPLVTSVFIGLSL